MPGRLFTIFTAYIVCVFLAGFYNGCACDRFPAWSCPLKRAVYSTPDSQCPECYIYRLYRLSTLDTMQKIGVWEWVVINIIRYRNEKEGLLKVTDNHMHYKSVNMSEMVRDRDVVFQLCLAVE